jgi:hypothetical protein
MRQHRAGYVGAMDPVLVVVMVVVVVLLALALAFGARAFSRSIRPTAEHSDRLQNADRPTLRYEVPNGQDPAVAVAELQAAGYDVSADSEPGPGAAILIIGMPSGAAPDRERLRTQLARIDRVNIDPGAEPATALPAVRFLDEA